MELIKVKQIIEQLTFEEKCILITGATSLETTAIDRVGIPQINMSDGPHGIRRLIFPGKPEISQKCNIEGGDTCFPTASAMGSSWNREMAFEVGAAIAKDCKEENIQVLLAPGVNMKRTPHCGRNFEYYSEDPYLSGILGAHFIQGVQSQGVGTSLKHFAANNQEHQRGTINVEVDERTLREYYLKPFEIVLKYANPTSVMCAYNKLNGIWCSENPYLLTEILKDTWSYKGLAISDWGAVHNIAKCLKAGLHYQMPKNPNIQEELMQALEAGILTQEDIDCAAKTVVEFILGIVELGENCPKESYDRKTQHEVAYRAACETITLLKNDQKVLPIKKERCKKIAVIGRNAVDVVFMGGGSSKVTVDPSSVDIPLEEIKKHIPEASVDYYPLITDGFHDVTEVDVISSLSHDYDYVLFFAGTNYGSDSETEAYDRDSLMLVNHTNEAIAMAAEKNQNMILILQSGGAVIPRRWDNVPAIVQMWYSGEAAGKAVADILFGKVNPSGKLSETFMRKERYDLDYPGDGTKVCYTEKWNCGYRYYDRHTEEEWFPFGFGLSYTDFAYSDLSVSQTQFKTPNFSVDVAFKLKNTGAITGKEVVQLYIAPVNSVVDRPIKELKRFDKIELKPNEEKTVTFQLNDMDFAYFNTCLHDWHVESGYYEIMIASSCRHIQLKERIIIYYNGDYTIDSNNRPMLA